MIFLSGVLGEREEVDWTADGLLEGLRGERVFPLDKRVDGVGNTLAEGAGGEEGMGEGCTTGLDSLLFGDSVEGEPEAWASCALFWGGV